MMVWAGLLHTIHCVLLADASGLWWCVLAGYDRWPCDCDLQYKKVGNTFQIKIADFGLSALKPKKSASLVWEKVGTVNTMAPEILQVSHLLLSSFLFGSYTS
jgi:serine/threonine protein kinase